MEILLFLELMSFWFWVKMSFVEFACFNTIKSSNSCVLYNDKHLQIL